jgi:hypothetical protein
MAKDNPALRWAVGTFLVGRIAFSAWAMIVVLLNLFLVSNLTLFGAPVVAVFDLRTSERAVFARVLDGRELFFRPASPNIVDAQTNSVWDLNGSAISGTLAGSQLQASHYPLEDIFPYRGVKASSNVLLAIWQRFDTNWYLKIAERGYAADDGSTVYFPLYPLLIRVVGTVLGDNLLAALLISNAALLGVFYLLYQTASVFADPRRALVYLLIFPTSFFLFAAYTESLFLLFSLASLREGTRANWGRAGIWGALAALTRLQGVLLIVPLAYLYATRNHALSEAEGTQHASRITHHVPRGLALLLIPLATASFLLYSNLSLRGAYESQLHARFVMPWENIGAAVALLASGRASFIDALNLSATLGFGAMLVAVWRKMPREFALYALLMFLAPLFRMTTEQPLVSMMRYVIVIFPVFMLWAKWGENAWVNRAILYLSFPLLLYLSAQFVMWGWVG